MRGSAGRDPVPHGVANRLLVPLIPFVLLLALWELARRMGSFDPSVFPGPMETAEGVWALARDGTLVRHAVASLFRVTLGFYLAALLGIPLGIVLGWWRSGQRIANPLIQFLRPISPLAWIPLAMLWFGIGDRPAIFLIFLSSFFPLLVCTMHAVVHISPVYLQVGENFGFSRYETITRIIVPAILPEILPALRISLGIAWLVVVAAEMIAVKSGLGYLILDSRNALRMDLVIGAMIAIGVIGICLDRLLERLGKIKAVEWGAV